jgi:hypothetical protein
MASIEPGSERPTNSRAWSDALGAWGFASLGAVLGLGLWLWLVCSTMPPAPAVAPAIPAAFTPEAEQEPAPFAQAEEKSVAVPRTGSPVVAQPQPLVSASAPALPPTVSPTPKADFAPLTTPPSAVASSGPAGFSPSPPSCGGYSGSSSSSGSSGGTVHVRG